MQTVQPSLPGGTKMSRWKMYSIVRKDEAPRASVWYLELRDRGGEEREKGGYAESALRIRLAISTFAASW